MTCDLRGGDDVIHDFRYAVINVLALARSNRRPTNAPLARLLDDVQDQWVTSTRLKLVCKRKRPIAGALTCLAEEVGFEPTEPCGSTVFKTAAFNHSAIPPYARVQHYEANRSFKLNTSKQYS